MSRQNIKGSALIQVMVVVALLSVLVGVSGQMTDLAVQENRQARLQSEFEALGRYIATLGADDVLCVNNFRPIHPVNNTTTIALPATVPAGTNPAMQAHQFRFRIPMLANPANPADPVNLFYPRASPNQNTLARFNNLQVVGLTLWNSRYTECKPGINCQTTYAADPFPELQGDLVFYGREPLVNNDPARQGFRRTIARLKIRVDRTNGNMVSCFSTITDQQFCEMLGAQYAETSPTRPTDRPYCHFPLQAVAACPGANQYISNISATGQPTCSTITPCGVDANGEQMFAVGINSTSLVCSTYPRDVVVLSPTATPPPAGCIGGSTATCTWPSLADSQSYSVACTAPNVGTCSGQCSNGTWINQTNNCAPPAPTPSCLANNTTVIVGSGSDDTPCSAATGVTGRAPWAACCSGFHKPFWNTAASEVMGGGNCFTICAP
jgi:hypothetical protein